AGALFELNRLDESIAAYDRALDLSPGSIALRSDRAFPLLLGGNFPRGLADYETRKHLDECVGAKRSFPAHMAPWTGQPLASEKILLYGEQGAGDIIQFLRYVPLVQSRGGRCTLEVPIPSLKSLAQTLPNIDQVLVRGEPL